MEIVAEIAKRFGRLDIMVSNAGIGIAVPSIVDMTLGGLAQADCDQSRWRVSLREALPASDAQDRRRLDRHDVVARGPARRARACRPIRATKGGVRLFAKSIAMECRRPATAWVNSVHPGIIDTPIWGEIPTGRPAPERMPRSTPRSGQGRHAARPRRAGRGDRNRRAVSGLRCLALRHRQRARHRRRHEAGGVPRRQ